MTSGQDEAHTTLGSVVTDLCQKAQMCLICGESSSYMQVYSKNDAKELGQFSWKVKRIARACSLQLIHACMPKLLPKSFKVLDVVHPSSIS